MNANDIRNRSRTGSGNGSQNGNSAGHRTGKRNGIRTGHRRSGRDGAGNHDGNHDGNRDGNGCRPGRVSGRVGPGLVLCLLSLLAAGVQAQVNVAQECQVDRVMELDVGTLPAGWSGSHPRTLRALVADRVQGGAWSDAADVLIGIWVNTGDVVPEPHRTLLRDQLIAMRTELAGVEASTDFDAIRSTGAGVRLARFQPVIADGRAEFFLESATPLVVEPALSPDAVRTLCWTAIAADDLLNLYGGNARARALSALKSAVRAWDNFNTKGYSQYPWELFINGRGGDGLAPPSRQIVLLHPSVGIELAGRSLEHLRRLDVLSVEPLGLLFYRSDRAFYFGISSVLSFPSDADVGAGALLHVGPARAGYIFRSAAGGGSGALFTLDLYQLLAGAPEALRSARDRVQDILQSAFAGTD